MSPETIEFLGISKDNGNSDDGTGEYELIVGYVEKSSTEKYREYYLVYPSEDYKNIQKMLTGFIEDDWQRIDKVLNMGVKE